MRISIAVPCIPRPGLSLDATCDNLKHGGFTEIRLALEPGFDQIDTRPIPYDIPVIEHPFTLGHLANLMYCWKWLLETTTADYLMVVENDVRFCRSAAARLRELLTREAANKFGLVSLFTPDTVVYEPLKGMRADDGWVDFRPGIQASAGQCMCLRRQVAADLFARNDFVAVDWYIHEYCKQNHLPCWYANPSLADHVATYSAVLQKEWSGHKAIDYEDRR